MAGLGSACVSVACHWTACCRPIYGSCSDPSSTKVQPIATENDKVNNSNKTHLPFKLKSMFALVAGWNPSGLFNGCDGWLSKLISKLPAFPKSTLAWRALLTSKKSALRKSEKSSTGAGSASRSCWGDGWLSVAMYWDTLGPRCPL